MSGNTASMEWFSVKRPSRLKRYGNLKQTLNALQNRLWVKKDETKQGYIVGDWEAILREHWNYSDEIYCIPSEGLSKIDCNTALLISQESSYVAAFVTKLEEVIFFLVLQLPNKTVYKPLILQPEFIETAKTELMRIADTHHNIALNQFIKHRAKFVHNYPEVEYLPDGIICRGFRATLQIPTFIKQQMQYVPASTQSLSSAGSSFADFEAVASHQDTDDSSEWGIANKDRSSFDRSTALETDFFTCPPISSSQLPYITGPITGPRFINSSPRMPSNHSQLEASPELPKSELEEQDYFAQSPTFSYRAFDNAKSAMSTATLQKAITDLHAQQINPDQQPTQDLAYGTLLKRIENLQKIDSHARLKSNALSHDSDQESGATGIATGVVALLRSLPRHQQAPLSSSSLKADADELNPSEKQHKIARRNTFSNPI